MAQEILADKELLRAKNRTFGGTTHDWFVNLFIVEKTSGAPLSGRKHHAGFLDPAFMCLRLFG
jgi:hypothetical protein